MKCARIFGDKNLCISVLLGFPFVALKTSLALNSEISLPLSPEVGLKACATTDRLFYFVLQRILL